MMRKPFYFLIILFAALGTHSFSSEGKTTEQPSHPGPITASAEAGKGSITVGEPLELKITVRHKKDIELISGIDEPEMPGIEVKSAKDWADKDGSYLISGKTFTLSIYQLGNYLIEPIEVSYRTRGSAVQIIKTNPVYITVKSVAEGEEKTDIRDVKGVVKLPYRFLRYAMIGAGLLLVVVLLLAYFLYFRNRADANQSAIEKLSPAEQALRDLHELFDSGLIREGRVKNYYFRLSEILKIFIEKQFGIQATEATTSEISRLMKRIQIAEDSKKHLIEVLEAADFAKFAKWVPAPADILNLNKQAETVVTELSTQLSQAEDPNHAVS